MARKIGVGLWGVGAHAERTVLPALSRTPGIELVGLTSRNDETAARQAAKWACAYWPTADDMLADDRVGAVYVATPTGRHFEHGLRVIGAGRHLWSEKALTVELDQTLALADAATQRGVGVCTVCAPLYHSQFRCLVDLMRNGRIGAVKRISAEFGFPHLAPDNIRYRRDLGGGALLDVGFYLLSLTARLVGETPATVHCRTETAAGHDVDTSGSATLVFPGGVEATLEWGYGRPYCNALTLSGESRSARAAPAFSKPAGRPLDILIDDPDGDRRIEISECDQFVEMLKTFADSVGDSAVRDRLRDESVAQQTLIERVRQAAE